MAQEDEDDVKNYRTQSLGFPIEHPSWEYKFYTKELCGTKYS